MTFVRRVGVLLAAVVCAVPAAATGLAGPASGSETGRAAPAAAGTATLVRIRAAHHSGFDRVVFEFRGGLPASRLVSYVPRLTEDASGLPVRIAGRALLKVRMEPAQAHDDTGEPTAPLRFAVALPNVMNVVRAGDFEAVTTYGIGLAKRTPFTVFTLTKPSRLVIDVGAAFPTVQRKVYFLDEPRFVANTPPFFVPVLRPVLPGTPATGVMDRIFAGPGPAGGRARTAAAAVPGHRLHPAGGARRGGPGAARRGMQQRRVHRDDRRRDHAVAAPVLHRGLRQDLRPGGPDREPQRPGRLDPGVSGAVTAAAPPSAPVRRAVDPRPC